MGCVDLLNQEDQVLPGKANLVVSSSVQPFPQSYLTMGPMKTSSPEDKSILVSGMLWRVEVDICFWSASHRAR